MLIKNYLASTLTNTSTAAATHAANDGLLTLPATAFATASNGFQVLRGNPHAQVFLTDNASLTDSLRDRLQNSSDDLESQDKLTNFQIQDLMSEMNQAEALTSSIAKKKDDTAASIFKNL